MSRINWNRARVLAGETMREAGILVLVFAPLDSVFEPQLARLDYLALAVAGGMALIVLGILLETQE